METNTVKVDSVLENVAKVRKIIKLPNEDVYNMEVEKYHNFAVNGGLIVHNCMDCLRYICQDLPYNYLDRKRASLARYINMFKENKDTKNTLSFREMLDIISEDNMDMEFKEKNKKHTGGYTIC